MATILVRTQAGDGCAESDPNAIVFLDPARVMAELEPWVMTRGQIVVELGNEPNVKNDSEDAAWVWQYWFEQTAMQIRSRWPSVRIVAGGLHENNQETWWAINQAVFSRWADAIGYHAYCWYDYGPNDTGQIQRAHDQLARYYPNKAWMLTETGINDVATPATVKAQRYSSMHSRLPSQTIAALYYHYTDAPLDDDQKAYQLPVSAFDELKAGGTI